MSEPSPLVGIGLFAFNRQGQLLLGKRINPRNGYGEGLWQLPGGHAHKMEELSNGAIRELAEETGMTVKEGSLLSLSFSDGINEELGLHYVECFFCAEAEGTLQNLEPDKCDGWEWFEPDRLPSPLFPCTKEIADKYHCLLLSKSSTIKSRNRNATIKN